MSRSSFQQIVEAIPAARQEDARHYGVHPYFTRRPANVVREYIKAYSRTGDTVLDPFGGTGVTAIEAFLLGRIGIQNDLNPFANFIAKNIADTSLPSLAPLRDAFVKVKEDCQDDICAIEHEGKAQAFLKKLKLPQNIRLPKTSDAEFFYDMFTPHQLAGIGVIKESIERYSTGIIKDLLLLAWSASIAKLNKTFLSAKGRAESRGGSSIFSIYRYKIASETVELPIWETFEGRFSNVLAAKEEVLRIRDYHRTKDPEALDSRKAFKVYSEDATKLGEVLKSGSVDYIFTDPPYGGFITYLDLSVLWNHWLGFPVSEEARQNEIIVGGECEHSEDHYKKNLAKSIKASLRLLKPDRWYSIVFQHWDISYFSTILETADSCGADLKTAITQTGDVIWSMHKKKNSESVLAGEMILTFHKPASAKKHNRQPKVEPKDPERVLREVFDSCLNNGVEIFTSEALFNRLIIELWHRRALNCLSLDRDEFAIQLKGRGWDYNEEKHVWTMGAKEHAHIGQIGLL